MEISIKRLFENKWCTIGSLTMDGFKCSTIELPPAIYNNSKVRIPQGRYKLRPYLSPRFGFTVPLLQDVPNRTMIEIHPSNYAIRPQDDVVQLEGCIALGVNPSSVSVDSSRTTFDVFMKQLDWNNDIWLIIED